MLLRYEFENFKSFADTAYFEMFAPNGKIKNRFPDNFITLDIGEDILKEAFIVGENAGGKSNFIESLAFLKSLFHTTENVRSRQSMVNDAFLVYGGEDPYVDFDLSNTTQSFSVEMVAAGNHYCYALTVDHIGICRELLVKKGKSHNESIVFEALRVKESEITEIESDAYRAEVAYRFSSESEQVAEQLLSLRQDHSDLLGLFIVKLAFLGQQDSFVVVNWIMDALVVEKDPDLFFQGTLSKSRTEEIIKTMSSQEYLEIFKLIDASIVELVVDAARPFTDSIVVRENVEGAKYPMRVVKDSSGVQEFLAWALYIYQVVFEEKTVFADEVDRVINPVLAERVIAYINGKEHKGQFIFTTHNILHLSLRNYMKEQIYFATKDKDTLTSSLYSLADFKDIRYDLKTEIYEFYLRGVLGGTAYE